MSRAILRRGRRVTLRLVVSRFVVSNAAAFARGTIVVVWSIEDAFPVVHGRVVDAVSEHERTIFKGLDVACVNVGAPVCVWTHELELCCAKSGDVEVGPEGLDVSLRSAYRGGSR